MPLAAGTRFGPYEILVSIGAGGMGEVYRARDTRLDRIVAIKVLPEHLSSNSQLRERFDREAKAISSLSHPHICSLYDIGHQDGIDYLVMEYLDGETLANRLKKGPLPPDRAMEYAIQITDALDTAHKHCVIHRDLKPGNIMLTKSGAKLLDFGLAKVRAAEVVADMTAMPTQTTPLTGAGTILGTLQYMAPEQLEGEDADARTDIFAFGVTLYEMLTGRKAFEGKSQASLISAIMTAEPTPVSTLQRLASTALDRVISKCLAKDPEERWQSARDLRYALEEISTLRIAAAPAARSRVLPWIVAAVALAVAPTGYLLRPAPEERVVRTFVPAPEKAGFMTIGDEAGPVVVSPNGRRLAFTAPNSEGKGLLWIRPLDSATAQPLAGTEGATFPFWSPDSSFVGFFAQGKLKKIDANGGTATTLADASTNRGGTWSRDGVILFAPTFLSPLFRISQNGGGATGVTRLDEKQHEVSHRWPSFLPDGKHFLYTSRSHGIWAGSLDTSEPPRKLLAENSHAIYCQGFLLFSRGAILMAQPFDTARREAKGDAAAIAESVQWDPGTNRSTFSVAEHGMLVYHFGLVESQLRSVQRSGNQVALLGTPALFDDIQLSPDGTKAIATIVEPSGGAGLWVYELARGLRTRLTQRGWGAAWSPDGTRVAFTVPQDSGVFDTYVKTLGTPAPEQLLLKSNFENYLGNWSVNGFLAISQRDLRTGWDMLLLPLADSGGDRPIPVLHSEFNESLGMLSPDGHWMVYTSDESGGIEVYIAAVPSGESKRRISTAGGNFPRWRADGKELFYVSGTKLMSAEVSIAKDSIDIGASHSLFDTLCPPSMQGFCYDVSLDGKRFLVIEPSGPPSLIAVIQNWTARLKK